MTSTVNADQFVPLYEQCRVETLERCIAQRGPELADCRDITEVNAVVGHVVPHLLELDRRHRRGWSNGGRR
jgi:hypothetical protein